MQLAGAHHLVNSLFRHAQRRHAIQLAHPESLARVVVLAIVLPGERSRPLCGYGPVRDLEQILDAFAWREQHCHFLLRHRLAVQRRYQVNPLIAKRPIALRLVVGRAEPEFARVDVDIRLWNTHPGVPRCVGGVGGVDLDIYDGFFVLEDLPIMYLLHVRLLLGGQHARLRVMIGDQYVGALDPVVAQYVPFKRHEHFRCIYDVFIGVRCIQDGQYSVLEPALQALYTAKSSAREVVIYDPVISKFGNRHVPLVISRLDPIPGIRGA